MRQRPGVGKRARAVVLAIVALASAVAVGTAVAPPAGAATDLHRVEAADPAAAAARVSALFYPQGQSVVFVAASLPDAIMAGAAAGSSRAPLLLLGRDAVPDVTAAELARLQPGRIVVVGGSGAVSDAVLESLLAYSANVSRIAGGDRYETAAALSSALYGEDVATAFVAHGDALLEAAAAGAAAGRSRMPLLLTTRDAVPPSTAAELTRLDPVHIVLGSNAAAVSGVGEAALAGLADAAVLRFAGPDAYATVAAISHHTAPTGKLRTFIASTADFALALAAVPTAALFEGSLLLVGPTCMPEPTRAELSRLAPAAVVAMGTVGTSPTTWRRGCDAHRRHPPSLPSRRARVRVAASSTRTPVSGCGWWRPMVRCSRRTSSRDGRRSRVRPRTACTRSPGTPRPGACGWSTWSGSRGARRWPSASTRSRSTGTAGRSRVRPSSASSAARGACVSASAMPLGCGTGRLSGRPWW